MNPTYKQWRQENWDRAHRDSDLSALTGTGLGGHLATLGAAELVAADAVVLCIGVGTGEWIVDLAARTKAIWCLDCSVIAKAKVDKISTFISNPRALPSNHFDLALSLWVAPHMTDEDLQEQLNGVIPSLRPTGVLAIHYKEPLDPESVVDNRAGKPDEWVVARGARMLRSRERFWAMVQAAGGCVQAVVSEYRSPFYQMIEVSAHITRSVS